MGDLRRALSLLPAYAHSTWEGLFAWRLRGGTPPAVAQAVILQQGRVLLALRRDLFGWELPGGACHSGESHEEAITREVEEETGLRVDVKRPIGCYLRSGFRPHQSMVYLCQVVGGRFRSSSESRAACWFSPDQLPDGIFPWCPSAVNGCVAKSGRSVAE